MGARRIRETFEQMRNAAPAILFIDEFDALGAARGGQAGGDESSSIINELLVGGFYYSIPKIYPSKAPLPQSSF